MLYTGFSWAVIRADVLAQRWYYVQSSPHACVKAALAQPHDAGGMILFGVCASVPGIGLGLGARLGLVMTKPRVVCGRFITNRSARASKDHHCIFGLQTSSHSPGPRCVTRQ